MLCVLVNYKTSWLFVSVTLDQKFKSVVWEPPDVTYVTLRNRRSNGCKWVHSGRTRTKLTGKTPQVPGCPSISPNYRQRKKEQIFSLLLFLLQSRKKQQQQQKRHQFATSTTPILCLQPFLPLDRSPGKFGAILGANK